MVRTGANPGGFSDGVVTLLYKKGKRNDIRNYRPISLFNVDDKIFAKVLANKMKEVAGHIMRILQAYGVPRRKITDSIITIQVAVMAIKEGGGSSST